ncbi:MAG: PDZ domain-containing protein, partial [Desulfotomaculales bacterium]
MFPFERIFPLLLGTMAGAFLEPFFWIVVFFVAFQYRRMAAVREGMTGLKEGRVWLDTFLAVIYGVVGGFAGSLLIVLAGLTLSGAGLLYLWPVAILLLLIEPRFLCFAYAGGLLAVTHLLFGFPSLNVAQILALVAILHMVESILILVSGHLGAVPGYF